MGIFAKHLSVMKYGCGHTLGTTITPPESVIFCSMRSSGFTAVAFSGVRFWVPDRFDYDVQNKDEKNKNIALVFF